MGTPTFAREILEYIYKNSICDIVAVIMQPDKATNRKKEIIYSPVKQYVLDNGLLYFQPNKIGEIVDELSKLNADAIVTCAYGQFLPKQILDLCPAGVINIHASLLPKYRGGAPIQYAILNGEKETGISLMKSVLKMDAGPVYVQKSVTIAENENLSTLTEKLIVIAKDLVSSYLVDIIDNKIVASNQDESLVTFAYNISKEQEKIDFLKDGRIIANHINALYPIPCAYGYVDNKRIKFGNAKFEESIHSYNIGNIIELNKKYLKVAVSGGYLYIENIQLEGKKMLSADLLYNGNQYLVGRMIK